MHMYVYAYVYTTTLTPLHTHEVYTQVSIYTLKKWKLNFLNLQFFQRGCKVQVGRLAWSASGLRPQSLLSTHILIAGFPTWSPRKQRIPCKNQQLTSCASALNFQDLLWCWHLLPTWCFLLNFSKSGQLSLYLFILYPQISQADFCKLGVIATSCRTFLEVPGLFQCSSGVC